jgi:hypothetical protein
VSSPRPLPSAALGSEAIPFEEIHQWYRTQLSDAMERIAFLEITVSRKTLELDALRKGGGQGA